MTERDDHTDEAAIRASAFRLAAPAARTAALRGRARRVLAPGDRLAEGVGGGAWVALVVAGIVRVYMSVEGSEPTLLYGSSGAVVGTQWLGTGPVHAVGMEALTPSVVIQLDPRRVERLIATDPAFALALLSEGRGVTQDLALAYAAAVATRLPDRLAREIVVLADLQPNEPFLPVTEQQLADGVGTIRESVGRAIADFRRRGWLATTRYGIIVLDLAALRSQAMLPVPSGPPAQDGASLRTAPAPRLLRPGPVSSGLLPVRGPEPAPEDGERGRGG
jgi:CRP-like cAMP-binding protein